MSKKQTKADLERENRRLVDLNYSLSRDLQKENNLVREFSFAERSLDYFITVCFVMALGAGAVIGLLIGRC